MPGISSYKFIAELVKSEVSTVCRYGYKFVAASRQKIKIKTYYLAYKTSFFLGNMILLRFSFFTIWDSGGGEVSSSHIMPYQLQIIAHSKEEECRIAKVFMYMYNTVGNGGLLQ